MTRVNPTIIRMVEDICGGPPVQIGKRYVHPEHGPIEIISGQYWGTYGLSNHWHWKQLTTGKSFHGYAGEWPEIKDGY